MERVTLIPTGDEIADGVVVDTDSPAILAVILEAFPQCEVRRIPPVRDSEEAITAAVEQSAATEPDLVFLIGGSGGGDRFAPALAKDFTHSALEKCMPGAAIREICGGNGHLWSRLVAGRRGRCWVINVPGPQAEAVAAARAAIEYLGSVAAPDADVLVDRIAGAVIAQYPGGSIAG